MESSLLLIQYTQQKSHLMITRDRIILKHIATTYTNSILIRDTHIPMFKGPMKKLRNHLRNTCFPMLQLLK